MTVPTAISGEADVAARRRLLLDRPQIRPNMRVIGNPNSFPLKRRPHWISQLLLDRTGEIYSFDFIFSEALLGSFGELSAQAGLIYAAALQCWKRQEVVEGFLLRVKTLSLEGDDSARIKNIRHLFHQPEDREVVVPAEVNAQEKCRVRSGQ